MLKILDDLGFCFAFCTLSIRKGNGRRVIIPWDGVVYFLVVVILQAMMLTHETDKKWTLWLCSRNYVNIRQITTPLRFCEIGGIAKPHGRWL
jgi:hypothetical protein